MFKNYVGTHWEVAIWWIKEDSYGGCESFKTRDEADAHVAHMRKLGYGTPKLTDDNRSEVHMRQVSKQIVRIL